MPDPVPDTDNHNLPKVPPLDSQYSDEWGFILNDGEFADGSDAGSDALVEALEERTPIVDTAANRGEYFPYADALFIASDTGQVSLGDGASWNSRGVVPNDSDVLDAINGADIAPNLVDANAVNTDDLSNSDVSKGNTKTIFSALESTDDGGAELLTQPTDGVGDTTTAILSLPGAFDDPVVLAIIRGNDGDRNRFYDIVQCTRNGSNTDVINSQTNGTPAGRTYAIDTTDSELTLAMDSGTYDVVATGILSRRDI